MTDHTQTTSGRPAAGAQEGGPARTRPRKRAAAPGRRIAAIRSGLGHFTVFGAPGILIYGWFVLVPIALSVYYSLTNANPFNPPRRWVGLDNYQMLLHDQEFLTTLRVTVILTLIVVVVPNVVGLLIALMLDKQGRFYNAMRSVFFTPMILSSVVVSVIWTRLLDVDGPLNQALRGLGVNHPPAWLSDPDLALYAVASIISWQMLGFCVVVYLAGLQSVPVELHEAAAIDGASAVGRFRAVTWPLLAPAVTINTVVLLISAFKTYDYIKVITNGGPGAGTTSTIAFNVLATGFDANHVGYASAMAIVMLAIVCLATAVALRILRAREIDL